jgi:hypothetical protein
MRPVCVVTATQTAHISGLGSLPGARRQWVGEDAVRAGEQLAQAERRPRGGVGQDGADPLEYLAPVKTAVGADRGKREISGREIGRVIVVRTSVGTE